MKRYDLIDSNMHRSEEMCEDAYGDWVTFEDAQASDAAKDAEIAELRNDAERYRWLRSSENACEVIFIRMANGIWMRSEESLDYEIDAAIAAEKEQAK